MIGCDEMCISIATSNNVLDVAMVHIRFNWRPHSPQRVIRINRQYCTALLTLTHSSATVSPNDESFRKPQRYS